MKEELDHGLVVVQAENAVNSAREKNRFVSASFAVQRCVKCLVGEKRTCLSTVEVLDHIDDLFQNQ